MKKSILRLYSYCQGTLDKEYMKNKKHVSLGIGYDSGVRTDSKPFCTL